MTKIIITLIVAFTSLISMAQNQIINNGDAPNNMTEKCNEIAVYKLFPTQNMWTFIKLNTRNGKMYQVQFDLEGNDRFATYLNSKPLVSNEKEVNGRFMLYSTENMWTFILLDQLDGKVWQVQWALEPKNRFITPIEFIYESNE